MNHIKIVQLLLNRDDTDINIRTVFLINYSNEIFQYDFIILQIIMDLMKFLIQFLIQFQIKNIHFV